jgi:signal transduction histidine kinase
MPHSYDSIEHLKVLHELTTLIRSDSKLEEKYIQVLGKVNDKVRCNSASLFIYNELTGKLEEAATVGEKVDLIESINFDLGQGFSAWVAKHRRPVLLPSIRKDSPDGFRSFISVPLLWCEKLIGVMNFGHNAPNALTEEHMHFLEVAAGQLAYTIERARFEKELIGKNTALEEAQDEIKNQQQQIIEMEKFQVLAQTAVSINHAINNPLTTIIGTIDLLLISHPNIDPYVKKKLALILSEANRIADIIRKIRNIKRIVIGDYHDRTGEKMLDINSSSNSSSEPENLSSSENLADPSQ